MLFDHDLLRSEFDWTCVDKEGYLGYFSTAGAGPIPGDVAKNVSLFTSLLDEVLAMDTRGEAIRFGAVEWDATEWLEIARRGFFGYDWQIEGHRYRLIAAPSSPVRLEDLADERLRAAATLTRLPVDFAGATSFVATSLEFRVGIE